MDDIVARLQRNRRLMAEMFGGDTLLGDAIAEIERLRAIVSAIVDGAHAYPFCPIGHWVEHGPVNNELRSVTEETRQRELPAV